MENGFRKNTFVYLGVIIGFVIVFTIGKNIVRLNEKEMLKNKNIEITNRQKGNYFLIYYLAYEQMKNYNIKMKKDFQDQKNKISAIYPEIVECYDEFGNASKIDIKKLEEILGDNEMNQKTKEEVREKVLEFQKEKENFDNALSNMRTEYDDIKGITWYYDKSSSKYARDNNVYLYIGKDKDSSVFLRFRVQYASEDWLFIEKYIFKTDNETIEYEPSEVKRDNNLNIWEWSDESLNKANFSIVKKIISSNVCKLRYEGDKYYNDRVISSQEKKAFQNVLDAYCALGGTFSDLDTESK